MAGSLLAKSYSHLGKANASISSFHLAELWFTSSHSNLGKAKSQCNEKWVSLYSVLSAVDPGFHALTSHCKAIFSDILLQPLCTVTWQHRKSHIFFVSQSIGTCNLTVKVYHNKCTLWMIFPLCQCFPGMFSFQCYQMMTTSSIDKVIMLFL